MLTELFALWGVPEASRSDNGPEFVSRAIQPWPGKLSVETLCVAPGDSLKKRNFASDFLDTTSAIWRIEQRMVTKRVPSGQVSLIDLSNTDAPEVMNFFITDLLRHIQRQDKNVRKAIEEKKPPVPVDIIVEEAQESLSEHRIRQMPFLFQQVACIAKHGRNRRLGFGS